MFDKMKELWDMKRKMEELKKELDKASFEMESQDKSVRIVMNGSQEVKEVRIQGDLSGMKNSSLETLIKDTFNRALKRSHDLAAEKMKSMTGLNIPGLM